MPYKDSFPLFIRQCLTDVATPLQLFHTLTRQHDEAVLLESTDADTRLARFSFIAVEPDIRLTLKNGQATLVYGNTPEHETRDCSNPWSLMRQLQADWFTQHSVDAAHIASTCESTHPAVGGWFGYTGYNAVQYKEAIPQQGNDPLNVPDVAYGFYPRILVFDHLSRILTAVSISPDEAGNLAFWNRIQEAIQHPHPLPALSVPDKAHLQGQSTQDITSNMSEASYLAKVAGCKDLIAEGEVFQIVLAQRFSTDYTGNALSVYRALIATNPSPYAYVLKYPDFYYLGSSPETFVDVSGDDVVLRALAGTRKRGETPEQDARLANELRADEKELAEHKMLVDLGRNDLGRLCEVGSVQVGDIAQVHYYTHVMHLATEIRGKRTPTFDAFDIFAGVLPRGTVSGAPKIRAMQHLARLEPDVRGIYAGAIGFIDVRGNLKSCIAIRSALLKDGQAHVQAGAGVVYDSVPELEYMETLNKAQSVLTAIAWAKHG
jgi:anthranilate synthase component I